MNNYRDHLYIPDNLNEGAMWDKVKGFVGKHKKKLMAGAGLLGTGYLASKLVNRIHLKTDYKYDPKTGKWYEISHSLVKKS